MRGVQVFWGMTGKKLSEKYFALIMEGVKLFKVHCTHVWNYQNEPPLYYLRLIITNKIK
jgi:hypothetical protein